MGLRTFGVLSRVSIASCSSLSPSSKTRQLQGLMHPIHDAPDDVLREIFLYTYLQSVDYIYGVDPHELLKRVQVPWNISQVSRNWRAVVTHIPQMWSTIVLHITRFEEEAYGMWNEYVRRSLERSKTLLLSVLVCTSQNIVDSSACTTLFASARRWRRLIVDIPMDMHDTLSRNPPSFDALEELCVENPTSDQPPFGSFGGMFKNAPKLHHLNLEAPLLRNNSLPLQQIDTLDMFGSLDLAAVLRLRAFPDLDDLVLNFCQGTAQVFPLFGGIGIHLPISSLELHQDPNTSDECIAQVFELMVLPYLQHLHLVFDSSFQLPTQWHPSSIGFSSLTIGGQAVDYIQPDVVDELISFLLATTEVEELNLYDGRMSSQIISRLTLTSTPSDSSPLLPALKSLECIIGPDDHEAMFEMVLSRIKHAVPFKSLRLNTPLVLTNTAKAAQWEEICASKVAFVHITEGFYD